SECLNSFDGMHGYVLITSIFFFSSRRRHTRFSRDWSSDVCSSDLLEAVGVYGAPYFRGFPKDGDNMFPIGPEYAHLTAPMYANRSEERRVGKECRPRRSPYPKKKNDSLYPEGIENGEYK